MQLLSDGLIGHIAGPGAHVDDAALGLVAGGDGGRRGGGVRAEGGAVVGGHAAHLRELVKAQLCLGDGTVADEQENILGLFGQAEDAVLLLSSRGSRCGCAGGHRGGAQQTGSRCHSTDLQEIAAGDLALFHSIYPLFSVLPDLSSQTLWERFHSTVLSRRPKPWPGKEWVKPLGRNRRKGKEEARFVSFLCFAKTVSCTACFFKIEIFYGFITKSSSWSGRKNGIMDADKKFEKRRISHGTIREPEPRLPARAARWQRAADLLQRRDDRSYRRHLLEGLHPRSDRGHRAVRPQGRLPRQRDRKHRPDAVL